MLTEAQFKAEFNLLRQQPFWNSFDDAQLKIILGTMIAAGNTGGGGGGGISGGGDASASLQNIGNGSLSSIDNKLNSLGVTTKPIRSEIPQIDGVITTANATQVVLNSSTTRNGFEIFNPGSKAFNISIGVPAQIGKGISILPNGSYSSPSAFVSTSQVNIICDTVGQSFTVISY